jgi:mono/diheme cytochrome c family protein
MNPNTSPAALATTPVRTPPRWPRRVRVAAAAMATLLGLAALAVAGAALAGHRKAQRTVELPPLAVLPARTDADSLARGAYLYASRGCADCHGADGTGRRFLDDPSAGLAIKAPAITRGGPAAIAGYTDADWTRLLRHGVKPAGQPAMVMPVEDYARMTDADLAAIVAYVRSLPPAAGGAAEFRLPLPMWVAYGLGVVRDAAEKIDHRAQPSQPVPREVSVAHGAYVAQMCVGCHGATLEGGRIAGGPPNWPAAARLAAGPGSVMDRYPSGETFIGMLRSGRRPDGSAIQVMPFEALSKMDDVDARALHLYLTQGAGQPQQSAALAGR